ncbi:hypothetical protein [Thermogemmatispora sp.]|uniref:hypothetical protein n=1 Tax=Thermogemmatispora sp. TaxID=1968838 RepID=UPI0035E40156
MKKSTTRLLSLIGLALLIIGLVLLLVSIAMVLTSSQSPGWTSSLLVALSPMALIPAIILLLIAWIGALIRTAQLGLWGWFAVVFFFTVIGLLIYSFAGPEIPTPTQQSLQS